MNPFSKIFLINLGNKVGQERLEIAKNHLGGHGIEFERFKATEHPRGAWGLLWTMRRLFIKCVAENLTNVLVLEDDAEMMVPFWPFIDEIWPQLPLDYDCLCLGTNLLSQPIRVSQNILQIRSSYATHAIVYSISAIRKILIFLENNPTTLPYDIVLMKELQPFQKCYCTFPQLCLQRAGYSSIENDHVDWAKHATFTFHAHTFQL